MAKNRRITTDPKPLSDEEVARFLKHLAAGYRDKRTGNPLLADALARVAARILDNNANDKTLPHETSLSEESPELNFDSRSAAYERMHVDEITRLIQDITLTKAQLVEVAAVRFGIPRSNLLRLTVDSVRDAIKSAAMHEASLAAITEEAARYGARRQS